LTVYRNKHFIVYEEFDGKDNILNKRDGKLPKHLVERFFWTLEESNAAMTRRLDYSVDVCDGSCWKLKIRHSGNKLQKLNGTVEYPTCGKHIERKLMLLCEDAGIYEPHLFGCSGIPLHDVFEFTDKWLKIFTEVPQNANFLFEEEMGNDCLALGFEMDCGHSFDRAYSKGEPLNRVETLSEVINDVDDVYLLGSAIFSNWRGITHWSYESGFTEENKVWFLMALTRLKELVS
jgi:hypothetical protein